MLKRKRNFVAESRIEPIIVMIDARRLSKSLATALKDRAHGIPVQPNHSLPLRPAPLLPVRKTSTKCGEKLTTNCPNISSVISSDREENDDGIGKEENEKKKKKKKERKGETVISEFSEMNNREDDERNEIINRTFIGINFYDSVPKELNSDGGKFINGESKDDKKIRASKSLDGEERGEFKIDENRRKSFENRTTGYVSSDVNKRRMISDSDEKDKSKSENEESGEILTKKRKLTNDYDKVYTSGNEKGENILKTIETNNRKNKFPDIVKYRVDNDNKKIRDKIKIRSSITLKETLRKPYFLPDCPDAVPIEIAQAINRNDSLKANRNIILQTNFDKSILNGTVKVADNRFIGTNDIRENINEEIGLTNLPSMPTLEDGKTDPLSGMLTPPKEPVNDDEEEEKDRRSNLIGEAASMLEAEIQKTNLVNRIDDFEERESIERMKKFEKDNLSNFSTVFEIKIPGLSPKLIFLNDEKILPSEKLCDVADNGIAEATIPESLPLSFEPAFDERRKRTDDDIKNIGALDESVKFSSNSLEKIDRKDKPFEKLDDDDDDDDDMKKVSAEDVVSQRIKRYNKKLEKLSEEENNLRIELSLTIDPQRITELNPKINCARKKKENIEKQIDKLVRSKEKSILEMKGETLPRIQVRKDLIESVLPTVPKSEEPAIRCDEKSKIRSPPMVITISESDSSSSEDEEEESVETETKSDEKKLEENSVQQESEKRRDTVIAKNFPPIVPENIEKVLFEIPESIERINESVKMRTRIVTNEDYEQASKIVSKESVNIEVKNPLNEDKRKLETPDIGETVPSRITEPIAAPTEEKSPTQIGKNNYVQNGQLTFPNFNTCNWRRCLASVGGGEGNAKISASPLSAEINFTSAISGERKSSGIVNHIEDNNPKDYRTRGNFSRNNGGANSDLSSPLQGHSALPLPQPHVQNLTAQGYPPAPFPVPENHQTTQLQIQLPVIKSSSLVNPASKQVDDRLKSPILAAHLLTAQGQEVPANLSIGNKIVSPANSKEIQKLNFEYGASSRIMTAQFPTLGNWVAEQISRKPVAVGASQNFNATTSNQSAVYKPLGSDIYKMNTTAFDTAHNPPTSETAISMWRPNPGQQIVSTIPVNPEDQRNKPNSYYRRDNQQFVNPQNNRQRILYNPQNVGYPGAEMMPTMPYAVHPSNRQNFQTKNNVNVNEYPAVGGQPKVWHYQPPASGIWLNKNNNNNGNPIGVLPQQQYHHHLQQYQQPIAPASSSYVKIQPAITNNLSENQVNSKVTSNVRKKKSFLNSVNNSHGENGVANAARFYNEQRVVNGNIFLPNPTVIHGGPTYIAVVQDQRSIDNGRTPLSSGSMNLGIVYPNEASAAASQQPTSFSKCLRCHRPDAKFNCADCEVAFYCNEYCQWSHWPTHYIECRKKMPKLKKVN